MSQDFKDSLSKLANSVAVALTLYDKKLIGCTVSSTIITNVEEPQVGLILKQDSFFGSIIPKSEYFTLNFLAYTQDEISRFFSSPNTGITEESNWALKDDRGIYSIKDCSFSLLLEPETHVQFDHSTLFLMKVTKWKTTEHPVLIYQNRKYRY